MARSSPLSRRAPPAAPKSWHAVHCMAHLEQPLPRTTVDSIGHSDASRSIDRSNSQRNTTRNRLSTRCNAAAAERAPHCAPDASQHVCFRARRRIAHQRSPVVSPSACCCVLFCFRAQPAACLHRARDLLARGVCDAHVECCAASQWAGQTPDFTRQSARAALSRLTGDHQLWHGCTMQRWWQQSASSIGRWLSRRCRRQLEHTQEGEPCSPALAPKHC